MDWAQVVQGLLPLVGVVVGAALTSRREGRSWDRDRAVKAIERAHDYWSTTIGQGERLAMAAEALADATVSDDRRLARAQEALASAQQDWRPLVYRREFEAPPDAARAILDLDRAFVATCGMVIEGTGTSTTDLTETAGRVRACFVRVRNEASLDLEGLNHRVELAYRTWVTRSWADRKFRREHPEVTSY